MIEIMAPAGNFEALHAAIKAGTNSVYFGVGKLNMRARAANNFSLEDLDSIIRVCGKNNVNTYLTLNTVMYDEDIEEMKRICDKAKEIGITAVIASDLSVISYANSIGLDVHISTQANVSNIEVVRFYSKYSDVMVLARELCLKQIKEICEQIREQDIRGPSGELVQIELFIHGALCVSISGKCYMSLANFNHSANRGDCLQPCRRTYRVIDEETGKELVIGNKYVMSPKDLCTIRFLDKILATGAKVLKIEGRGRPPEYVYTVVKAYREAVDSIIEGDYSSEKIAKWEEELKTVFNRGFWHGGYYLGKKLGEWSGVYGSEATKQKKFLGLVRNYYSKSGVGEFILQAGELKKGEEILVIGPTTGVVITEVKEMMKDEVFTERVEKGDIATIKIGEKIRKNDKLYLMVNKN